MTYGEGEPARQAATEVRLSRREFVRTAGLAGLAAITVGVMAIESPHAFERTFHRQLVRGVAAPLRLSLLTDFHLGPTLGAADLARWVDASNTAAPDLVVIAGDIVDQHYRGDLGELVELLPLLRAPLGVYAVTGNHDRTRFRRLDPLARALDAAGVRLLLNDGVQVRGDLYLAGIDDFRVGRPDVAGALAAAPVPSAGERPATLLVSHNPDVIPELTASDGTTAPIDLLVAGHTHGGQIRLPGFGPLVTSSAYGARYAAGWVPAPMPAFVSRGLGVTTLPFRFACPAEVVVLDLEPA